MRALHLLLLLAPLVLAGCASGPAPTPTPTTPAATGALPPAIHETKDVQASLDPPGVAACSEATTQCFHHRFQLNASASLNATLTWGIDRNDFDLYLFNGANETAASKGNSGTSEHIAATLGPGSYDLVVGGSTVAADTYKLDATFTPA